MFSGVLSILTLTLVLAVPGEITPDMRERLDKKVSISFQNVDVRIIVDYIVEETGLNVVIDPRPFHEKGFSNKTASAFLVSELVMAERPAGEVLSTALTKAGLAWKIERGVIWISDSERIRYETSELLETRVYVFKETLSNKQLKFIESTIDEVRDNTGAVISKFLPSETQDMVIIKSAPSRLAQFEAIYHRLFKPADEGAPTISDQERLYQLSEKFEQLSLRIAALENILRSLMPPPGK